MNSLTFSAVLHRGNSGFTIDFCTERELCHRYSISDPRPVEGPLLKMSKYNHVAKKRDRFFSSPTSKNTFEEAAVKQVRCPLETLHLRFKECQIATKTPTAYTLSSSDAQKQGRTEVLICSIPPTSPDEYCEKEGVCNLVVVCIIL